MKTDWRKSTNWSLYAFSTHFHTPGKGLSQLGPRPPPTDYLGPPVYLVLESIRLIKDSLWPGEGARENLRNVRSIFRIWPEMDPVEDLLLFLDFFPPRISTPSHIFPHFAFYKQNLATLTKCFHWTPDQKVCKFCQPPRYFSLTWLPFHQTTL